MGPLASLAITAVGCAVGFFAFGLVGSAVQGIMEKVRDKKEEKEFSEYLKNVHRNDNNNDSFHQE